MSASLKILACQVDVPPTPDVAARDAHLDRLSSLIDDALTEERADLVVLPELSSIDYSRESFDQLAQLAEPLDGPSFHALSPIARKHGASILYGFPRIAGNRYRISLGLIGSDGEEAGCFDKLHLAQYGASMEKEYFEPGEALFMFEVNGVKLAPIICYDLRFPELSQTLCQTHGAQVMLHCGAYYTDESYWSWHHFVVTRALENQVFMLSLNRAGETYGGSLFCAPWVDETQEPERFPKAETLKRIHIDTGQIAQVRADYTFVADTRDVYDGLDLRMGPT